jgi:hypothetical protein
LYLFGGYRAIEARLLDSAWRKIDILRESDNFPEIHGEVGAMCGASGH